MLQVEGVRSFIEFLVVGHPSKVPGMDENRQHPTARTKAARSKQPTAQEVQWNGRNPGLEKATARGRAAIANRETIKNHLEKFLSVKTYQQALVDGEVIVVVFAHPLSANKANETVATVLRDSKYSSMQVLVLAMHSFFSYTAYLHSHGEEPARFDVDSNYFAQRYDRATGALLKNQRMMTPAEICTLSMPPLATAGPASFIEKIDFLSPTELVKKQLELQLNLLEKSGYDVWMVMHGATRCVTVHKLTAGSLKDAVKAEYGIEQGPLPLLVRNHAQEVLDDSASLTANTPKTPYVVLQQEIWVKYGTAVFTVESATNDVGSLKNAVKDPNGSDLEGDMPLKLSSRSTPHVVRQN